jgi:DNA-binding NarL/FixJ family response regulator
MVPLNFLIVDDEPMLLDLLQQMLAPHTSKAVGTFQDACILLSTSTESFDVILSDLMMPQGSGLDLYHWIAENKPGLEERLLFLTGGVTQEIHASIQATEQPVLFKPFSVRQLHAAIEELVSEHLST